MIHLEGEHYVIEQGGAADVRHDLPTQQGIRPGRGADAVESNAGKVQVRGIEAAEDEEKKS